MLPKGQNCKVGKNKADHGLPDVYAVHCPPLSVPAQVKVEWWPCWCDDVWKGASKQPRPTQWEGRTATAGVVNMPKCQVELGWPAQLSVKAVSYNRSINSRSHWALMLLNIPPHSLLYLLYNKLHISGCYSQLKRCWQLANVRKQDLQCRFTLAEML